MYKRQHTWKKESPEAFNIKIQIGISQEPPGKDSKKVRIAYFHIWFQWDLCQIILLFDKSNPKKYFVFPGCLEISLKFTYKHTDTTYHLPVVWDQMRKQGPGPPASGVSEVAACPPAAEDPSAYHLPPPLPPPISNSSWLFTHCQPLNASSCTGLLYFSRYCAVRLKMLILCIWFFGIICVNVL